MNIVESENFIEIWGTISSVKSLRIISEIKNDLNLSLLEWRVNGEKGFTSMHSFRVEVEKFDSCEFRLLFQKRKMKNYQTSL